MSCQPIINDMPPRYNHSAGMRNAIFNIILASCLCLPIQAGSQGMETVFYYVDREECFRSFQENIAHITIVAPQVYSMDGDGVIWGSVDSRMMALAKAHGVQVMPLVMNPGFNQQMLHNALQNPVARRRAVNTMVALCQKHGFVGIQFDFENIHIDDRKAFTQFFRETAEVLHKKGFQISAAVVPRTGDFAGRIKYSKWIFKYWRTGYDLRALGKIGDFISIMTYDQHTRLTTPGPVAGMPWLEENLKFVLSQVPAGKVSIGFPLYSRHWFPDVAEDRAATGSRGFSYERAAAILEQNGATPSWLEDQGVHMAMFPNRGGQFEYLFLEDGRSFQAKLKIIGKYGLRGFSAWRLGHEDPEVWRLLEQYR